MNRKYYLFFLTLIATLTLLYLFGLQDAFSQGSLESFDFRRMQEPSLVDLPALRSTCNRSEWVPNIFLRCEYRMGAFNGINKLQVCIRWAIDAGIGLVAPRFLPRNQENLGTMVDGNISESLDYFFDEKSIFKRLHHNCPKMVIANLTEIGAHNTIRTEHDFFEKTHNKPNSFRKFVRKLISKSDFEDPSLPTVIFETKEPLGTWDVLSDPLAFQLEFHSVFKYHPSLMKIANKILENLPYLYVGLHLRMELDWGPRKKSVETFVEAVAERIEDAKTKTVFVACGDLDQLQEFKTKASPHGWNVVTKWDLVSAQEKEMMDELDFDQLGIVDFEVLVHSTYFVGAGLSSLSSSVGLRRHIAQYGDFEYTEDDAQQYLIGKKNSFYGRLWG
eukprot:Phypoly_transcript_08667.p1 GENE.Phypoly_transcript_08667~~Phypoly_transcript_08667.p1  ORF type:complete len:389 (+),score=61.64 Phypoly_transcript_08667:179-1345(+)